MQELRWILLLVGVLFLIVLAAWEILRARRSAARREPFPHLDREFPREPSFHAGAPAAAQPTEHTAAQPAAHSAPHTAARSAAHSAAARSVEPPLGTLPEGLVASSHLDGAAVEPIRAQRGGPPLIDLPQVSAVHVEVAADPEPAATIVTAVTEPVVVEPAAPEVAAAGAVPAPEIAAVQSADLQKPATDSLSAQPAQEPTAVPRVDWPPDGERQILSIRIVSTGEQRLSGRAVRQALAASGFVHGRYHIFHQAAEDGRVLLSCASLSKPGNFDPSAMDFQRYSGLSIFTVLPGPLPPQVALERLLTAGRDVSQRLQARLLDERGEPLDSMRIAALRARAAAGATADGSAGGGSAGGAVGRTVAASAVGGEPRA